MIPASPYKGLAPFTESDEDAARFSGRDEETRIIAANLLSARLTILYGPAGVGKSSVLRAGLVHRLRHHVPGAVRVAVVYVDSWAGDPCDAVLGAIAREAERLGVGAEAGAADDAPLDEALEAWEGRLGARLLIVLDQFEEYCLYHAPDEHRFDRELPAAIERRDLRVRFLIGLREDAIAALDRYKGRVGDLLGNRLRLDHLSGEAALTAIRRPVEQRNAAPAEGEAPVTLEPGLAESVVAEIAPGRLALATQGRGTAAGRATGAAASGGGGVETPYLQLVMDALWKRELGAGSHTLRLATLRRMGGATEVVRSHVDGVMGGLAPAEQEVAAQALHFLVTPSGTKVAHTADDLAAYAEVSPDRLRPVLERLGRGDARLLRRLPGVDRDGPARYEVFHDVLGPAILDWRARAFARRLQRRTTGLLGLAFALVVALAGSILYSADPAWLHQLERRTVDARASVAGPPIGAGEIVIVDFDRATLRRLAGGRWPPRRTLHAELIEALVRADARLIAYDIDFERATADDARLHAGIRRARGRIILAAEKFAEDGDGLSLFGRVAPGGSDALLGALGARSSYNAFPDSRTSLTGGPPEDALIAEVDALVAYAPQTRRIPTLSFLAARTAGLRVDPWPAAVPIEFREPGAIRTVSAADVLAGRTPPGALRDKLVLVGTSAPQAGDLRRTPARRRVPGVEIHANALLTAAAQARRPARDILLIAALALFPVLLFRARPVVAALGVAGAAVAYLVVAQLWFGAGRVVPVVVPLGALLASAAGLALARTLAARRARRARDPRGGSRAGAPAAGPPPAPGAAPAPPPARAAV